MLVRQCAACTLKPGEIESGRDPRRRAGSRVRCERQYAVHVLLACQGQHGLAVRRAHVVRLVRVPMARVIGQEIARDDVMTEARGMHDGGHLKRRATENEQPAQ